MPSSRSASVLPVVAAVIRRGDGAILLARRRLGGPHGGLWEFPGGKVEDGEDPRHALEREIREELALRVRAGGLIARVDHVYPHVRVSLSAYACAVLDGAPRPVECWQVAWVPPARLLAYPMPEADLPVARELARETGGL